MTTRSIADGSDCACTGWVVPRTAKSVIDPAMGNVNRTGHLATNETTHPTAADAAAA